MKDPKKRLRRTIALALVFLIIYAGVLFCIEQRQYNDLIMKDSVYKTEAVRSMIEGYEKTADEVGSRFWQDMNAEVRLMAIRLEDRVVNGEYKGVRFGDDSMVVLVRDGRAELPPEAEGMFPALTPEMITNEYVQTRTPRSGGGDVFLTGGRIAGDWYLVRWIPEEVYMDYITSHLSEEELLDAQEFDNDTEAFVVRTAAPAAENAGTDAAASAGQDAEDGAILYQTKGLTKYSSIAELGITREDLNKDSFTIETDNGKKYICIPVSAELLGHIFVCCNSVEGMNAAFVGDTVTQILLAAAMMAGLVTWCFSVQWLVGGETEEERQERRYNPDQVKKRTVRLTVMSTAVVTFFAFLTVMMQCMYQETRVGLNVLSLLQIQAADAEKNDNDTGAPETERYERLGITVSEMITEERALLEREKLAGLAEAVSADYIIVFDENGTEIACSRPYSGFDLPSDPRAPFSEFRRLLGGVRTVTKQSGEDFITGETRAFVGTRCDLSAKDQKDAEHFGAVLIALPSLKAASDKGKEDIVEKAKEQVYGSIKAEDRMILEMDPETHRIVSGTGKAYLGSDMEGLGIDPKELKDRRIGFYRFDDEWYYGVAKASENAAYIYLTDSTEMSRAGLWFALVSGILFLIGYVLTAKFSLKGYSDGYYELYAQQVAESADGYLGKIEKKAPSMSAMAVKWRSFRPEEKTRTVLQIGTGIIMAVLMLIALGNSPLSRHSALSFAVRGNWSRGLNLFSVIALTVVCCVGYLIYLILKLIFGVLYSLADPGGDTVLGLIQSFLNYVLFIGTVCMSLGYMGIDTTTILASLGILSLAISLGAKDFVTDIIAGLSIILEKTFSVGDFIQIGDFKGKVLDIGVRSTKIVNGTHDVKIISNHEISNVINYSQQTTVCVVKIKVPVTVSVTELRELFDSELPEVRKINPHIISGPNFDGIIEFNDDSMTISVSAEGPEQHINSIKLDLNQALQSMAERQLLQYAQSDHITINLAGGPVGTAHNEHRNDPENKPERVSRLNNGANNGINNRMNDQSE